VCTSTVEAQKKKDTKTNSQTQTTVAAIAQTETSVPKKITTVEGITEYNLSNGLRVLLFPDQSKPTITVNITYLVGSRHEGYGESGMAHLLEHMVFKGSTNHPNIPQELSSHGARPNGTTWLDRTNYFETFSATDENLRWALSLESDRMINSFIKKEDLESEFSVVRNEFESGENNPEGVLMERVMSTGYLWHNYGKSTIGSKEDIERVPIENLRAFYKKYYQPDNAVLTIAGKIDQDATIKLVNEYFGKIPRPTRELQPTYTVEPTQDGERFVELRRVGDVQVVAAGYHIPSGAHADYAAVEVLTEVLTNEPSGRLYKALVESKKASATYGYSLQLKDPGYAYFAAQVLKDKSLTDANTTMMSVFDNLSSNKITDEEVTRAKNTIIKYFELMYNNSDRVGLTLSEYIAQGDWRLWFLYRDAVEKVTADDVNRVAQAYFKPSNRTVGTFIPVDKPDRATIPASPDVTALVKDYKGKAALAEAEAFDPSCANIDKRTTKGTIPGGAKYAFLTKSTRGSSVNAQIKLFLGSEKSLVGKGLTAEYCASMLKRGTKTKSYQQINDAFDSMKASVSISGSGQTLTVNITTVKDRLNEVMALVNDILRNPSFPADEFDKMKEEDLASIDQSKSDPQSLAINTFTRMMNNYDKSDYRYTMTFEEKSSALKALKLEDVKKFYTDFYNGSNATVAVVGDFDAEATAKGLSSMLANWTSTQTYSRDANKSFNNPAKVEKLNTPDKANAMMICGHDMNIKDDNADYPSLIIGNYMLGGGFLNSRLATRIRQKEGISYGVGSQLRADAKDESGSFISYAIYNPDNSAKLIEAYKDELNKMLTSGFTSDELKDAISGYLQGQNVSRSQDRTLASRLNSYLEYNRTFAWDENIEKAISTLNVDQVNTAMKKWISPTNISYVEAGDFNRMKDDKMSQE